MSISLRMLSKSQEVKTLTAMRGYVAPNQNYITIKKSSRRLMLFQGNNQLREYPVAIGKPSTPTPEGNFAIAVKVLSPGGVLGSRWLGLNFGTYGIHGTNNPSLIGQMVSHGCIRMHDDDVENLFASVYVGTPVYIRD